MLSAKVIILQFLMVQQISLNECTWRLLHLSLPDNISPYGSNVKLWLISHLSFKFIVVILKYELYLRYS
ncbi:hypothetical protein ABIC22_004555 [Paenibacillus sp. PvP094]